MAIRMIGNYHEAWDSLKTIGVAEGDVILKDVKLVKTKAKYSRKSKKNTWLSDMTKYVTKLLLKEQQRTND